MLDTSIVTTALPVIKRTFDFSAAGLSWVQSGYVLAFGGLLLLGARAGDLLGRRRVFLGGVAVFTLASAAAGGAQSAESLLVARSFQGVAAAFAIPSTLALLVLRFPAPEERTRAIALYSAVIGAGGSLGLVVGGVFTDMVSWRWGLIVNVPIGLAILVLAPMVLPETPRRAGRFDLAGALTSTVGMTSLVYGLTQFGEGGHAREGVLTLLLAAVLLSGFILLERHATNPIVPLRLFVSVSRTGAYIGRILIVGAMFSMFYFLSQYLQDVLRFTALETGLAFVPLTGLFFAMVYAVPILARRLGRPPLLLTSLLIATVSMFWMSRVSESTHYWPGVLLPLLVLGVGQGIAIILLTELGMADVDAEDSGAASGLVNTAHQLGGSIGLAVLGIVFTSKIGSDSSTVDTNTLASGFSAVFTWAAGFYVLAVGAAVVMLVAARRQSRPDADVAVFDGSVLLAEPVALQH